MWRVPRRAIVAATLATSLVFCGEIAACAPIRAAPVGMTLVHPVVAGDVGPYRHAILTLERQAGQPEGSFSGVLDVGGKRLPLGRPDEPVDFFFLEVKAVLFTPIGDGPGNGIVILYDSSQIGPGRGTDHRALVYRVNANGATRERPVEARLEGVANAAQARTRLAARRRR